MPDDVVGEADEYGDPHPDRRAAAVGPHAERRRHQCEHEAGERYRELVVQRQLQLDGRAILAERIADVLPQLPVGHLLRRERLPGDQPGWRGEVSDPILEGRHCRTVCIQKRGHSVGQLPVSLPPHAALGLRDEPGLALLEPDDHGPGQLSAGNVQPLGVYETHYLPL